MEWWMNPERAALVNTARKFGAFLEEWAGTKLKPPLSEQVLRVEPEDFRWEMVREAGKAGLLAAPLPEDMGGAGLDTLSRVALLEETAKGGPGAAALLAIHWAGLAAISKACSENEEAKACLESAGQSAAGERPKLAGLLLPSAVFEDEDHERGEKAGAAAGISGLFIAPLHPGVCERAVLVDSKGEEPTALMVSGDSLTGHCQPAHPGSGLLEVPVARVRLRRFAAEESSILAAGDDAKNLGNTVARELYLGLAAAMAGNAAWALSAAWKYAEERVQTGRLIIEHQEVRKMLERMACLLEAARAMVYSAGAGKPAALDQARRAFMFAGEAGEQVCLEAMQTLGGYGYMKDYGIERRLRDHKTLQCLLGSYVMEWLGENI